MPTVISHFYSKDNKSFHLIRKKCYVRLTNEDYGTSLKTMLQECMPILPGISFHFFPFVCFDLFFVFLFISGEREWVKFGIVHCPLNKFTFFLFYTYSDNPLRLLGFFWVQLI